MGFAEDGSDIRRTIKHLGLKPTDYSTVQEKLCSLECSPGGFYKTAIEILDELDLINQNLSSEMASSQGALIEAGPLKWSENRYISSIPYKRSKIAELGNLLGLTPNYSGVDGLMNGVSGNKPTSGRLLRG